MKDNIKLYSGIILIVIVLIIGGIFLATRKGDTGEKKEKEIKYVAKKDNTKKWVYNAPYKREVEAAAYTLNGKTYKATDLVAPYINIDSEAAETANYTIKYKFNDAISTYNRGVRGVYAYVDEFDYKYYINGTILSVVITTVSGEGTIAYPRYLTYNFDLTTGNKLSFSEVYSAAGFTKDSLEDRVAEEISEVMDEKMSKTRNDSLELRKNNSLVNYKNSIKDEATKYYLSEDYTMNVIVALNIPVGIGSFENILTIK